MGEIASTVYAGLGEENVIGVIPEALQPREVDTAGSSVSKHFIHETLHCMLDSGWLSELLVLLYVSPLCQNKGESPRADTDLVECSKQCSHQCSQSMMGLQISGKTYGELRIVPDMHTRKVCPYRIVQTLKLSCGVHNPSWPLCLLIYAMADCSVQLPEVQVHSAVVNKQQLVCC